MARTMVTYGRCSKRRPPGTCDHQELVTSSRAFMVSTIGPLHVLLQRLSTDQLGLPGTNSWGWDRHCTFNSKGSTLGPRSEALMPSQFLFLVQLWSNGINVPSRTFDFKTYLDYQPLLLISSVNFHFLSLSLCIYNIHISLTIAYH